MNKKCYSPSSLISLILKPVENQKAELRCGAYNAFMITNPLLICWEGTRDKPLISIHLNHNGKHSRNLPENLIKKLGMMSFSFCRK